MTTNPLIRLGEIGQSPWYDFITRDLLTSGALTRLIEEDGLRGMTTNPTILEKAVAGSDLYDDDIHRLAGQGRSTAEIFEGLAVQDVRAACELFRQRHAASDGEDGLVSIEVAPRLAHDTAATIAEAERLWRAVGRPNAMIKIPGTRAGLGAVTHCIEEGINVNITLLFSVTRYLDVIDAFQSGLERRLDRGLPIERIASVASFFVSRVDTKVDAILDGQGDPTGLRGKAAIANAAAAYRAFEASLTTPRWARLAQGGASPQRPLWASTSTKDPRYPDVYYVEALIASRTVNTLPPETFAAFRDHGHAEIRIQEGVATAVAVFDGLKSVGISVEQVARELEDEGVAKFAASYDSVRKVIDQKAGALAGR